MRGAFIVLAVFLLLGQGDGIAQQVTLAWDYSQAQQEQITGFKLYRTTVVDGKGAPDFAHASTVVEQITPDRRRHTAMGLARGQRYYWAITAHDDDKESGISNTVAHTTPATWQPAMEVIELPAPANP